MARPAQVATNDPAMPINMVTMIPPGSLPGMMSFATAPMTSPINSVQSRCMGLSSGARMASAYRLPWRGGKYNLEGRRLSDLRPRAARSVRGPILFMEDGRPARRAGRGRPASIDRSCLRCGGNYQFLADLNLVGIVQVVGFGDD